MVQRSCASLRCCSVTGLDNYSAQPRHALHIMLPASHVSRRGATDCSPGDQTLTTADVARAYGYNALWQRGLHGEHMSINLVEVDGSYLDDVQNYLGCLHFQGHLSVYNVDGKPSDAQGESTLDIEMAAGLAPSATINLYYTATPGWDYTTGLGTPNLANFDQAVYNTLVGS